MTRTLKLALTFALCIVLGSAVFSGPAVAKKKSTYCAKQLKFMKQIGHKYKLKSTSGGIKFYIDGKYKDEFWACSDKRKTSAQGENFDDDPGWSLEKFVGFDGRCAIAVMDEKKPHSYQGAPLGKTVISAFRLYKSDGVGQIFVAENGGDGFDVPAIKFSKNCYAGWIEKRSYGNNFTVLDIGNQSRYEDPNSYPFTYSTNALTDFENWSLVAAGKGATLSWSDGNGANVKQIPAP
jgi:hypothetical protein